MLTIKNIQTIIGETYNEVFNIIGVKEEKSYYEFTLEYATVTLDRGPKQFVVSHYKLTSSTGKVLYITGKEISNMDIFIDKLRFVALN